MTLTLKCVAHAMKENTMTQLLNMESLPDTMTFMDDKETFLASIAISLKRIADVMAAAPVPVQVMFEEMIVRRGTPDWSTYLQARFPSGGGAPSPFAFQGRAWRYYKTSFDDRGEHDVLRRMIDDGEPA